MSPFLRKVTTASGATAVQIMVKDGRRNRVVEHLGSAHSEAELAALLAAGRAKLHAGQMELDLAPSPATRPAIVQGKRSRLLMDVLGWAWSELGLDVLDDEAFFQLVTARLVEPTSVESRIVV